MSAAVRAVIQPRPRDLGNFEVRRVLPSGRLRLVGPFIFFDHMGPKDFVRGQGIDVRPHPHIGLATVTYLFDGEILHRDSLGFVQPIRPGDVNWMTAGRGIVHSERTDPEVRAAGSSLHGIQSWVALPRTDEETEPSFEHHPAATLPSFELGDVDLTLIVGSAYGHTSPVRCFSPMFYLDARMPEGSALDLPAEYDERAIYVVAGAVDAAGESGSVGQMLVFEAGVPIRLTARTPARVMLVGGASMDGPRHIWWNFVSSSEARIERAKRDWREGRFDPVPGETEFIPLPES
ncbi:MAG TPA: pirin family protein [Steroidobacteraceae bacterium]|nr:pirin family protein [Steroidobacteraceae bacterium]